MAPTSMDGLPPRSPMQVVWRRSLNSPSAAASAASAQPPQAPRSPSPSRLSLRFLLLSPKGAAQPKPEDFSPRGPGESFDTLTRSTDFEPTNPASSSSSSSRAAEAGNPLFTSLDELPDEEASRKEPALSDVQLDSALAGVDCTRAMRPSDDFYVEGGDEPSFFAFFKEVKQFTPEEARAMLNKQDALAKQQQEQAAESSPRMNILKKASLTMQRISGRMIKVDTSAPTVGGSESD